jgi:hypothetical protein
VGSYSETGAQCAPGNAVSDDTPTPDTWETPAVVNDGCPVIGVPESLVIDATMDAASALPSRKAPQSCSDGVDNDNDGTVDAADGGMMGCVAGYYVNDADKDGVPNDGTDNCPSVWNPTQTNTDVALQAAGASVVGDAQGDVCDSDDDNDGFSDAVEAHLPTDPLDNCSNSQTQAAGTFRSDAWPLDMNRDGAVTVPGDALQYAGYLGAEVSGNPPASWIISRLDLNGDLAITVPGDVLKYAGRLGSECE